MNVLSRTPLFWKILAPAALSLLCLVAYLAFNTVVTRGNNMRIQDVRDVQYPTLDAMTENVAALDKLISTLNNAAASGDVPAGGVADQGQEGDRHQQEFQPRADARIGQPYALDIQTLRVFFHREEGQALVGLGRDHEEIG